MSLPGWNANNKLNLTIDSSKVDGNLDYFPVLITLTSGSGQTSYDTTGVFDELNYPSVDDDFTGNNGDSPDSDLWVETDSYNCLDIQNNKMHFTASGAGDKSSNLKSKWELLGDFDVQIDFDITTADAPASSLQYILTLKVIDSDGIYCVIGRIRANAWSGYYRDGTSDAYTSHVNDDASGKLRIIRSGTVIKGYYWDNSRWEWDGDTNGYTFSTTFSTNASTNIWAKQEDGCDLVVDYDNFKINSGTVIWPQGTHPNRKKIAVTTEDEETKLFVEIERWDDADKQAYLWAKVPAVVSGTDTELCFYYDKDQDDQDERTLAEANDTFTGNNGDAPDQSKWRTGGGTPTIQGNKLRTVRAAATRDFVYSRYKVSGDFDIQVDYSLDSAPAADSWNHILRVRIDASNLIFVGRYGNSTLQDYLKAEFISGVQTNYWAGGTTDANGKYRITRSGSTWHGYYWGGAAWVEIGSGSAVGSDDITIVELYCTSWSTYPTYTGYFDNFTINSAGSITGFVGDIIEKPAQEVWDDNFKLVCHMGEDPNGDAANAIKDSTRNGANGTPAGSMTTADLVDGQIAKNIDFDGTDDYIDFGDLFYSDALTAECIMEADDHPTDKALGLIGKRNIGIVSSSKEWLLRVYNRRLGFHTYGTGGSIVGTIYTNVGTLPVAGVKCHVCGKTTGNAGQSDVFINGGAKATDSSITGAIQDTTDSIQIACRQANDNATYFDGKVDEVRISNVARSDAWIKATYYSNWDDLITFGDGGVLEYYFSGDVYELGNTISGAQIFMYRRDTGAYLGATTSSGDGGFYVETSYSGAHFLVCLDPAGGQSYNDLVYGEMYPVTISG